MNDEFILNFISAAEGEKDPRNLVLLFSFFPNIAKELSLKDFAEDLFELVAAYFPIDFVPPKRDDFIVTTEDLTIGLRACMSSTDAFAPYCIPLLLEKLRLDNIDVKLESLRTLQACCKNYSGLSLRPHVLELWDHLRKEVIEGWNVDVEKEIIGSLSCLVETLERDRSCSDTVNILGSSALSECIPHLSNPEQRLMFPGAEVLLAVCRYSSVLSQTFCEKLIPLLVEQFSQKNQSIAKKNTLIVMAKFLLQGTQFSLFVAGQIEKREKLKNILDATSSLCRTTSVLKEALPPIWDTILKLVLVGDDLVISFLLCLKNSDIVELRSIGMLELFGFVKVDEVLKLGEIFYGRRTIPETFPEEVETFIKSSDRLVSFFSQNDLQHSPFMVYCVRCLLVRDDCPLKELRQDIAKHVVKWSLATEGDTCVKEKAASTVALFLLHSPSGEELDSYLCSLKQEINPLLGADVSAAVRLLGWIVKGLIMRGYPQDREWISMLLNMLTKEGEIGQKASECYKFLLKDDDSLLTLQGIRPKTYKLLYRQRFFESHIGEMVTMFNELGITRQGLRNNVLLAIFYLFPHLPQAVLKGHLKKLLPILVIGLKGCPSNDAATVAAGAVETLAFLLCHNVLQKLKVVLNDKKRVVRRAAAQARSAWDVFPSIILIAFEFCTTEIIKVFAKVSVINKDI
ncbi:MMS19 nucleotide excision repair-like protein [Armadillidium nasatum]|uniref:MMS19 nucleotide excision repair protein n=1 Tax=Armadillidium nasatum TaxID=96803 RepID=A0A5N5SQY0_9CRUS|nr:MMS19 nucleotide excision repair-like protein [Armadillidium nasatum]